MIIAFRYGIRRLMAKAFAYLMQTACISSDRSLRPVGASSFANF